MSARATAEKLSFDALADAGTSWLEWVKSSQKFEHVLRGKLPWDQMTEPEKRVVKAKLDDALPELQLLLNSIYITLAAGFEEYVRSSIKKAASRITRSKKTSDKIDSALLRLNIRESARLLKRIDSPPEYLNYDANELCRILGTCGPGSSPVEMNCEAIADIDGLIRLDTALTRLSHLGVKITWDSLGQAPAIKSALKTPKANTRDSAKSLAAMLSEVSKFRNRIAHMGGNASDVTEDLLIFHSQVLKSVVATIDGHIEP